MAEPKAMQKVFAPMMEHWTSFFMMGQLCGCNGSSSPSNATEYRDESGRSGG